jgi:hypothetical protein
MSAAGVVQAAVVAALRGGLGGVEIFDGVPARAAYPYAVIGEGLSSDWSHKSGRGREHRLSVNLWDDGESAARLHGLIGLAEEAIEEMGRVLEGHRVVRLVLLKSRVARRADGPWVGLVEYRVRTLEAD